MCRPKLPQPNPKINGKRSWRKSVLSSQTDSKSLPVARVDFSVFKFLTSAKQVTTSTKALVSFLALSNDLWWFPSFWEFLGSFHVSFPTWIRQAKSMWAQAARLEREEAAWATEELAEAKLEKKLRLEVQAAGGPRSDLEETFQKHDPSFGGFFAFRFLFVRAHMHIGRDSRPTAYPLQFGTASLLLVHCLLRSSESPQDFGNCHYLDQPRMQKK